MEGSPTPNNMYNLRSKKKKKQSPLKVDSTGSTSKRLRLLDNDDQVDDDFSKLPDDIVTGHILPRLNFKERVCSSVLSRRWKNLWRYSLGTDLVFHRGVDSNSLLHTEWGVGDIQRYMQGVDSILKSFSGPKLDHLSIYAGMDQAFNDVIRRWITLAIRRGVKRLNLRLAPGPPKQIAKFPSLKRFIRSSGGICSLKELSLNHVGIRGDTVEHLLCCCPFLELLSLQESLCSNLKISAPSLNLKHLEILRCKRSLKKIRRFPSELTMLAKLEELKVATLIYPKVRMVWPIGLLKAAPRLRKIAIKQLKPYPYGMRTVEELEKMKGATEFMHSCLKVLEVTRFGGNLEFCEMIERVLSIATTSLEKLVINYDEKETLE